MPKQKGSGKGLNKPITIRLPPDEEAFYRRKANEHGISLSAYLTKIMVAGVVAENILDVEERLKEVVASIPSNVSKVEPTSIPENVLMSIYTSEYLLTAIVEARSIQSVYEAQNKAKERIKKEKVQSDD